MSQDKEQVLKITTDQIEQKFGKGAIMKLGDSTCLLYTSPSPRD